jgi:hypothetical protein
LGLCLRLVVVLLVLEMAAMNHPVDYSVVGVGGEVGDCEVD